ncbi:hypothetical protein EDB86DRAFT_2885074 [Lactarius hatsudake]|nr:hypothetical protein EDB86DRAFT_2885074 [Lactarius hatsudake]
MARFCTIGFLQVAATAPVHNGSLPNSGRTEYSIVTFLIEYQGKLFLLLEVKSSCDFHLGLGREVAINQLIEHLDEIGPSNQHRTTLCYICNWAKVAGRVCREGSWE